MLKYIAIYFPKVTDKVGIDVHLESVSADATQEEVVKHIEELNANKSVDGILVPLPLPNHINKQNVCNSVSCDKDVDGVNERSTMIPCKSLAVVELIKFRKIETSGKNVVVVGRTEMPIVTMLRRMGAEVRFTPPAPEDLSQFCPLADIIITDTGVRGLIKADMVKKGASVFDVGLTSVMDPVTGKNEWHGDVEFNGAYRKHSFKNSVR